MKKFSLICIVIASLSQPVPANADPMSDMMATMFRMMLAMANHMAGAFGNSGSFGNSSAFNLGSNFGSGFSPWSGFGPWSGVSPWSGYSPWSAANPWSATGPGLYPGFGQNWPPQSPGRGAATPHGYAARPAWPGGGLEPYAYPRSAASSPLSGRWLAQSGEVFEVRGNRFRLHSRQGTLTGTLQFDNRQVRLFSPQTGTLTSYRYQRNPFGLALQDPNGQVLIFQAAQPHRL